MNKIFNIAAKASVVTAGVSLTVGLGFMGTAMAFYNLGLEDLAVTTYRTGLFGAAAFVGTMFPAAMSCAYLSSQKHACKPAV